VSTVPNASLPASARPRARHVVQQPPDLARREIGVDEQTGPHLNRLARAIRFEPLAEVRRPAVLPDDGVVNRFAGLAIPDDGRFALIRDADGRDVLRAHLGPPQGFDGDADLRRPDFLRVVLDPPGRRKHLCEFLLGDRANRAVTIEDDGA
jgi:hypothetical protein